MTRPRAAWQAGGIATAPVMLAVLAVLVVNVATPDRPAWAPAGAVPCATEDAQHGPCYWDAVARGNGAGRSFWVAADGAVVPE